MIIAEQSLFELTHTVAFVLTGCEILRQDPTVTEALQQVALAGWTAEARMHAESALAALASDRVRDPAKTKTGDEADLDHHQRHIMLSYQWACQVHLLQGICTSSEPVNIPCLG